MTTDKITCDQVLNHLCENLDEDLNSPACQSVKSHLNECPHCARYLKSLKDTIHLYKKYPSPKPSGAANRKIEEFLSKNQEPGQNE